MTCASCSALREAAKVKSVYVASSWRNTKQPTIVGFLRKQGFDVYDFRHPAEGDNGFHWSEIDPHWEGWSPRQFRDALSHPMAQKGFTTDMKALDDCDAVVLVMPCGRSSHLELGYAVGSGKPTFIYLSDGEPELMYGMATKLCTNLDELESAINTPCPRSDAPKGKNNNA